jgi:hypothetical protein
MLRVNVLVSVVLFIVATAQAQQEGDWNLFKTTVRVQNILGGNSVLVVHCHSSDNDLGIHNVIGGAFVEWKFRVDLRETTLFRCTLQWDNVPEKNVVIYDAKIDNPICRERCWREVRPDGLFFLHEKGSGFWEKRYSW